MGKLKQREFLQEKCLNYNLTKVEALHNVYFQNWFSVHPHLPVLYTFLVLALLLHHKRCIYDVIPKILFEFLFFFFVHRSVTSTSNSSKKSWTTKIVLLISLLLKLLSNLRNTQLFSCSRRFFIWKYSLIFYVWAKIWK